MFKLPHSIGAGLRQDEPAPGEAKQIANNSDTDDDEPEDPDEAGSGSELEEGAKNDGSGPR